MRVSRRVDGAMYVSTLNDSHYDFCTFIAKPNQQQIRSLPTFQAAIRGDRNMKRTTLVLLVRVLDHANLKAYRSKLYIAKDDFVDMIDIEWNASFTNNPYC